LRLTRGEGVGRGGKKKKRDVILAVRGAVLYPLIDQKGQEEGGKKKGS